MTIENIIPIVLGIAIGSAITALVFFVISNLPMQTTARRLLPFQTNIVSVVADNKDFRHVLFTGARSQLVAMSIPPGGEVGQEIHQRVEQMLYFQSGTGEAILNGTTTQIGPGDIVIVPPGTQHNFINTGKVPLQIFTMYAPPNHINGRIQHTIADEKADVADETFGNAVR